VTQAACKDYDPELFYPESQVNKNHHSAEGRAEINKGLDALVVCSTCPVIEWCLEYTFKNIHSIKFGISAGLLPTEKRQMIGYPLKGISEKLYMMIRNKATKAGVPVPDQPTREKPESFYDIDDITLLRERRGE
jgi:Transcription factor WhiB